MKLSRVLFLMVVFVLCLLLLYPLLFKGKEGAVPAPSAHAGAMNSPAPTQPSPKSPAKIWPEQIPAAPTPPAVVNEQLYILMYHHLVQDGMNYNDWTVTESRFREDLQWLSEHGYTTVLPSELADGMPLPERAVLITFDDGYRSNYELAYPILKEYQSKAVISLIVGAVEARHSDYLTWDMCGEMLESGLIEFGSHTYNCHEQTHCVQRIAGETQEDYEARVFPDIEKSIQLMEEQLDTTVQFFAYPHGRADSWADTFLEEHFAMTVTTQHGLANISGGLYRLPRMNIHMTQPPSMFLPD